MAEVVWHVEAAADLDDAAHYIARRSPDAAASFVVRIVGATERLRQHPKLGRAVPEVGDESYRELIFQNYRIVYRVRDDHVLIVGVIHAAMDMERQISNRDWDLT